VGRQVGLDLTEADLLLPGSLVARAQVRYGACVLVNGWLGLAV
jgi:hypothetical protein